MNPASLPSTVRLPQSIIGSSARTPVQERPGLTEAGLRKGHKDD